MQPRSANTLLALIRIDGSALPSLETIEQRLPAFRQPITNLQAFCKTELLQPPNPSFQHKLVESQPFREFRRRPALRLVDQAETSDGPGSVAGMTIERGEPGFQCREIIARQELLGPQRLPRILAGKMKVDPVDRSVVTRAKFGEKRIAVTVSGATRVGFGNLGSATLRTSSIPSTPIGVRRVPEARTVGLVQRRNAKVTRPLRISSSTAALNSIGPTAPSCRHRSPIPSR